MSVPVMDDCCTCEGCCFKTVFAQAEWPGYYPLNRAEGDDLLTKYLTQKVTYTFDWNGPSGVQTDTVVSITTLDAETGAVMLSSLTATCFGTIFSYTREHPCDAATNYDNPDWPAFSHTGQCVRDESPTLSAYYMPLFDLDPYDVVEDGPHADIDTTTYTSTNPSFPGAKTIIKVELLDEYSRTDAQTACRGLLDLVDFDDEGTAYPTGNPPDEETTAQLKCTGGFSRILVYKQCNGGGDPIPIYSGADPSSPAYSVISPDGSTIQMQKVRANAACGVMCAAKNTLTFPAFDYPPTPSGAECLFHDAVTGYEYIPDPGTPFLIWFGGSSIITGGINPADCGACGS